MRSFYNNSDIEKWIKKHRIPDFGLLDTKAMAKFLNIELIVRDFESGTAKGYISKNKPPNPYSYMILVNSEQSYSEQLFTFAHEIGHYFAWEVFGWERIGFYGDEGKQAYVELFCDWFARELMLPRRWLNSPPFDNLYDVNIALSDLCVSEETFLLQRMARNDIPPQIKLPDGEILCLHCCDKKYYRRSCSCEPQREKARKAARLQRDSQLTLPLRFK